MTAAQFKATRRALKLSQQAMGDALGVSVRTVQAWEQEQNPIPVWAERFTELLTRGMQEKS